MFFYEGLDDTFVMMNAWQRTDRSLDIPSRMGATMSEVSRVTATSLLVIRVTSRPLCLGQALSCQKWNLSKVRPLFLGQTLSGDSMSEVIIGTAIINIIITIFPVAVLEQTVSNFWLLLLKNESSNLFVCSSLVRDVCSSLLAHLAAIAATRVRISASCQILYIKKNLGAESGPSLTLGTKRV